LDPYREAQLAVMEYIFQMSRSHHHAQAASDEEALGRAREVAATHHTRVRVFRVTGPHQGVEVGTAEPPAAGREGPRPH
jgi:hypothetical protein